MKANQEGALATTIQSGTSLLTLINVFTVSPERQQELVDLLVHATDHTMRAQPGFVSANIHPSLDGRRVVNYAQWRSRAHFDAMLTDPEARIHMVAAQEIADFDPILCTVAHVDHA
ncbi:antibiotic biosynthesis monooxygenase family protein [Gaopeijia maritima]|uniref:antibiotic biosynthesis monooxygenase family protein n=1 Tax=Gaopeijia maritima TaxID=3119007 RepID=UPI003280B1ED